MFDQNIAVLFVQLMPLCCCFRHFKVFLYDTFELHILKTEGGGAHLMHIAYVSGLCEYHGFLALTTNMKFSRYIQSHPFHSTCYYIVDSTQIVHQLV